jgi:hypothetical protein
MEVCAMMKSIFRLAFVLVLATACSRTSLPQASGAAEAASGSGGAAPSVREVTLPAGTPLIVRLSTPVSSARSRLEDVVRGTVARAVRVDGTVVVPAGAEIVGSVVEARESGRVRGRARIAFRFDRLIIDEESHRIRTALISREASASTQQDVEKGGIGAAAGAVVGGILGGGKGAAVGAGVGGAGAVVASRGKEVRLPAGERVTATLQQAVTVSVGA